MGLLPDAGNGVVFRCDAFCKKVLKNVNINVLRGERRYYKRNQPLLETDVEKDVSLSSLDEYEVMKLWVAVDDLRFSIENEMLYCALKLLSERRLKIILMSYFAEMTDKQIGEKMQMPQSAVQYNRMAALRNLKCFLEEQMDENEGWNRKKQ